MLLLLLFPLDRRERAEINIDGHYVRSIRLFHSLTFDSVGKRHQVNLDIHIAKVLKVILSKPPVQK